MKKNPKVSILCITYNQEKYIRQALDSFFAQKTNFDFEVLIHDDASTDKTTEIINEYKNKYPDAVKIFLQTENQYSKGVRGILMKYLLPHAKGKYITICEGDDYFTDDEKLQIQADFLDKNLDCSMCFHLTRWFHENNEKPDIIYPDTKDNEEFTVERLLLDNFMNTNAVMYRRQKYDNLSSENISPADWYLHLYHARFGKIGFINKVMAAYRRHPGGIWNDAYGDPDKLLREQGIFQITMSLELLKLFNDNHKQKEIVYGRIFSDLSKFREIDKKYGTKIIEKAVLQFPHQMAHILGKYVDRISSHNEIISEQKN